MEAQFIDSRFVKSGRGFVSIIINNFNYEKYLRSAIKSALEQSYCYKEVVVVDDGSTDGSMSIIQEFYGLVVLVLKANEGQASAFNAGLAASIGDIVIFLDADDRLLPHAAEKASLMFDTPNVVSVSWPLWVIDERGGRTSAVKPAGKILSGNLLPDIVRRGPLPGPFSPTSGNAWSRDFLRQVAPVREFGDKHGADAYLRNLAPLFGVMKAVDEPLGEYRVHSSNFTPRNSYDDINMGIRRSKQNVELISEYLSKLGIEFNENDWISPETGHGWLLEMKFLHDLISEKIGSSEKLILVDDGLLGVGFLPGYDVVLFLELNGQYAGPPVSDEQAILELERQRIMGVCYMVFPASASWWFSHYSSFSEYLEKNYIKEVIGGVVIYDLR